MAKQTKLWNHEEIEVIYSKKATNIIYSECMATILRKKSEVSHRHYKVIQILGLSPTQKAVSVTRFDHVMGSKVQWAYLKSSNRLISSSSLTRLTWMIIQLISNGTRRGPSGYTALFDICSA